MRQITVLAGTEAFFSGTVDIDNQFVTVPVDTTCEVVKLYKHRVHVLLVGLAQHGRTYADVPRTGCRDLIACEVA